MSDAFLDIERDLLISAVRYAEADKITTDISVCSAEAFDKEPVGKRRTNKTGKGKAKKNTGPLDGKAEAL
ncbi:hypothetical protein D3C87_1389230 [compost metagenome]